MTISAEQPCTLCGRLVILFAYPIDANSEFLLAEIDEARTRGPIICDSCALKEIGYLEKQSA